MHVTSNILDALQLLQAFSGICFSFFFLFWESFQVVSFSTVALIVDINDIFCFFKLLVTDYSILPVVTRNH